MTRPAAVATTQVDDATCIVTEWRFSPGAETGWHTHQYDYVVVPLMDGRLLLEAPDGSSSEAEMKAGASYARPAGVEHNVVNAGDAEYAFVEVEFKNRPLG